MTPPDLLSASLTARSIEKAPGALRTISEASEMLDVPQHVLRFWETKFSQIRPLKRNGGRRYYRPADLELLQQIKFLLYQQGYTIKGAKKAIDDLAEARGKAGAVQDWKSAFPPANSNDNRSPSTARDPSSLASLKDELISLRAELAAVIERSTVAA